MTVANDMVLPCSPLRSSAPSAIPTSRFLNSTGRPEGSGGANRAARPARRRSDWPGSFPRTGRHGKPGTRAIAVRRQRSALSAERSSRFLNSARAGTGNMVPFHVPLAGSAIQSRPRSGMWTILVAGSRISGSSYLRISTASRRTTTTPCSIVRAASVPSAGIRRAERIPGTCGSPLTTATTRDRFADFSAIGVIAQSGCSQTILSSCGKQSATCSATRREQQNKEGSSY